MSQPEILLRSEMGGYLHCWVISGSMLIYGYCLTMLSACNLDHMRDYYQVNFSSDVMISTINGFYALGGLVACGLIHYFLRITTKRRSYYIFAAASIVASALTLLPNIGSLFFSRFLLGMTCSFSIAIAGMYIRQSFSERLRRPMGGIYSVSKMIGTEVCYILGYFLKKSSLSSNTHLVIFCGAGVLSAIQILMVVLLCPEVPVEMLTLKRYDSLNDTLSFLYSEQDIPRKIKELEKQEKDMKVVPNWNDRPTRNKIISALHLGLLRQFCGAPFVIAYSVYIFRDMNSTYTEMATLIINTIQVIGGILGLWLVRSINRSRLVIFSTIGAAALNFLIAVGDGIESSTLFLTAMAIYIMLTASCLQSVTWFYPFQCTGPLYGKYASFLSWFGTACLLIIPPFVTEAMPHQQSYPIFLFFGVYLCFSIYINIRYLVSVDKDVRIDFQKERVVIQLTAIVSKTDSTRSSPLMID